MPSPRRLLASRPPRPGEGGGPGSREPGGGAHPPSAVSLLGTVGNKLKSIVTLVMTLNWREVAEEAAKVVVAKVIAELRDDLPDLSDRYSEQIEAKIAELLPEEVEPAILPAIRPIVLRYMNELLTYAAAELNEAIEGINPADNPPPAGTVATAPT